jgi:spoIIIJ-associated protein
VAHAEASARTVVAAVTAAAAQLGLRSDQVDVEVLAEPIPSTFGHIGSPARVQVTPRPAATPQNLSQPQIVSSSTNSSQPTEPSISPAVVAEDPLRPGPALVAGDPVPPTGLVASSDVLDPAEAAVPPVPAGTAPVAPVATAPADDLSSRSSVRDPGLAAGSAPERAPAAGPDADNGQVPGTAGAGPEGQNEPSSLDNRSAGPGSSPTDGSPATAALTPAASAATAPSGGPNGEASGSTSEGGPSSEAAAASLDPAAGEPPASRAATAALTDQGAPGPGRSPRRTYRDEPIDPQMVEEDTERAGDFLEGLLDAMDVDGDITTWVDSVGGHIDLEGSDLDVLVGSNGETLDALQELTRLAVLRQAKRRVRLLIDINGYRARQRDQLVSVVNAAAEQVIRSREVHEFQPMTPAERKVVHDAVAAIDGVQTESLGEDPNRRVVIRPE